MEQEFAVRDNPYRAFESLPLRHYPLCELSLRLQPSLKRPIAASLSRLSVAFEAGTDEKVKQLLANYLIVGPLSFEATNARFKRDTEVMLTVLKEIGLKPE